MSQADFNIISPKKFVDILKRRVKKDWDAVVAITGEEGSSKSTLASWLVWEGLLYEGLEGEEAEKKFIEYTIFSPSKDRVKEQITKSERYAIINSDEAIKILYKQNWATPIQKFLNMFYALCRQENKISVLCMPRFLDFNEFFRNHRIKFWIHVLDRGKAVIFEKDWFPASQDPWFIKDSQKMNSNIYARKKTADFNTDQKIITLSKLKNFIGVIEFEDLPNNIKKAYLNGKKEFAYEDMEEQLSSDATSRPISTYLRTKMTIAIKKLMDTGSTQEEVAKLFTLSTASISNYLKQAQNENYDMEEEGLQEEIAIKV